jgi:hypothetical protein
MRVQTRSIEFMPGLSLVEMRLGRPNELTVKAYRRELYSVSHRASVTYRGAFKRHVCRGLGATLTN